ncbi:geranylgeranylglyceryl/heptaprenylglyceryl phosphate synthase [Carboxylicivirga marina]|uniref:Geranylgeranylglyceryl phosphate synthase n=1 Tax=Carboxylicivirga marina TaxID=2800988 RepID=A0ABS1HKT1_9BACT|nr:geranylgeranylglyceryl/heptaprenylglyceryl phosphate synthase [Carboxylicivirga marina]MBK3518167.1 geranylgeranylglyceryl/heptaprenylglyceryl phosphate synthase [Carboxylicivirga marina]
MIFDKILECYKRNEKQLAVLIDPDKFSFERISEIKHLFAQSPPDLLLVGGSLISADTSRFIKELKLHVDLPVILYPGSSMHVCKQADAVLFLSLISGRNPEFLISHHVAAAPALKKHNIEAISTGYMLIDGGANTSVQYVSQSLPIPSEKNDIAIATALAGQFLGMKTIYMDAGSGAKKSISPSMINAVKEAIDIPLMVGGGIRTEEGVRKACKAGADIVVVGNILEQDMSLLTGFYNAVKSFTE